ncbi:MAG: amidohydrolase [Candidatus Hydrogenedentota bacterium]
MAKKLIPFIAAFIFSISAYADKDALNDSIDRLNDDTWAVALSIWNWAEPGYQETRSSALLADTLKKAGFTIETGVADIPTAFTATYGSGEPVIGILGEFDALPGLAQDAVSTRSPREASENGYGQACGHHLFGSASMLAAMAIAEQIKAGEQPGTIRFYGTPAEEGGAAKVFMVRNGLFDDVDIMLHWHPGASNGAGDPSNLSRIAAKFRFYGKAAHAAGAPEQGRSALDAVELMNHAAQLMREHTPEYTRIHHIITSGGAAPNVVPDFAEVYYYVRHPDASVVKDLYRRLLLCADAGALATETRVEVEFLAGTHNLLPNDVLSRVTLGNLQELADLSYTDEEMDFARTIQKTLASPKPIESIKDVNDSKGETSKGSTDVGDVSWVVPTTGLRTACWVPGTPAHSWQAVAAGGTEIGRKGMILAARVLAATAWDIAHDEKLMADAKAELNERLEDEQYSAMLEPGQKAPLTYRDAPTR